MGKPGAGARAHTSDLRGSQRETAAVKRGAERQVDLRVAEPAELDDAAVFGRELERRAQARARSARVKHEIALGRRVLRRREARPEGLSNLCSFPTHVDQLEIERRQP